MSAVVFSVHAPRQSWGVDRTISDPSSVPVPTFSGVIGMIANALGRTRDEDISDLSSLGFAVRVDNPGEVRVEYQTQEKEDSIKTRKEAGRYVAKVQKNAVYLADASFTIAVSTDDDALAERIAEALTTPERSLYLGRSSMPIGFVEASVEQGDGAEALRDGEGKPVHRTARPGEEFSYRVRDLPVSFGSGLRHYLNRDVLVSSS